MERVNEMKTEPIVGKFYLVECVLYHSKWIPIVGSKHYDREIGIPFEHYHKDIRFIHERDFMNLTPSDELNRSLYPEYVKEIGLKRKRCVRQMPVFPTARLEAFSDRNRQMFQKLHTKYVGRKVLCGKCPHKGMPIESLPKDKDGMAICNGHGLKIDTNKMEVVGR